MSDLPSDPGVVWKQDIPYSRIFDDHYFCTDDPYPEALHVCCHGNRLQERFPALDPCRPGCFVMMETGFGTGLDFCCVWKMFEALAPASWSLHFISLEKYPLSREDMSRALAPIGPIRDHSQALFAAYPSDPDPRFDQVFSSGRVRVTVLFEDVLDALDRIKAEGLAPQGADAWSLDGFAPSKNPGMWSEEVLDRVAALSRPGTTLSTFSVTGRLRRGLEARGFRMEKAPGYGRKRQILTGVF